MTKYVKQVAELLSVLSPMQTISYINSLNYEQVKLTQTFILSQVAEPKRRIYLNNLLSQREQSINAAANTVEFIHNDHPLSEQLKTLYVGITDTIVCTLNNDEIRELLVQRATDSELWLLRKKIDGMVVNDALDALKRTVTDELQQRMQKLTVQQQNEINTYKKNIQWERVCWQELNNKAHKIQEELYKPPMRTAEEIAKRTPSFIAQIGRFLSNALSALTFYLLKATVFLFTVVPLGMAKGIYKMFNKRATPEEHKAPTVPDKFSEEELLELKQLHYAGAKYVADATGLTQIGGEKKRTKAHIESSIHSRLGMVIASQMVAATKNNHHRDLYTVIESLTRPDDTNATITQVQNAIKNVIDPLDLTNPLNGEHACATGGDPDIVTAMEYQLFATLSSQPNAFEQYGVLFSPTEKKNIDAYYKAMEQTKSVSYILKAVGMMWGGYRPAREKDGEPKNSYYKKEHFAQEQQQFEEKLTLASRALHNAIKKLADGQALYLETGLEGHAMQLAIKKEGENIKLSTYDSSGALENTSLLNGGVDVIKYGAQGFWHTVVHRGLWAALTDLGNVLSGVYHLWRLGDEGKRKNALTFTIPAERLNTPQGLSYLTTLVRSNTMAGWAQTHIELNMHHTSMEERSQMGWWEDKQALIRQAAVYAHYIKNFSSIASPEAPPQFEDLLQRPQNTENCFAKKAQACQLYELGKATYKKVRLATLIEQKQGLLNDICGKEGVLEENKGHFVAPEYVSMLRRLEPQHLSPTELYAASMRLSELKTPPTSAYYIHYFTALINARGELLQQNKSTNQLAIDRINGKINTHAKEFYEYLLNADIDPQVKDENIKAVFSAQVYQQAPPFDWNAGVMPLKVDGQGAVNTNALKKLSEFSTAQAWKATLQLMNHQIRKLSVKERHVHHESERLAPASLWKLSDIKAEDLIEANIINFNSGDARNEQIHIELNVGGTQREINVDTFFKRVLAHKHLLVHPKIVGLFDYLRNADPDIEKRYMSKVYPVQQQAFLDELQRSIHNSENILAEAIAEFTRAIDQLKPFIKQSEVLIKAINDAITCEEQSIGKGKNSVKLGNLQARLYIIQKELLQLEYLKNSAEDKVHELQWPETTPESMRKHLKDAQELYQQLNAKDASGQSINEISQAFLSALNNVQKVQYKLEEMRNNFNVHDIEKQVNDRRTQLNKFRQRVIYNHLRTNAEYRILEGLAVGTFGSERDKNKDLYQQTAGERMTFYQQGKYTYKPNSVYQKIQDLNQKLKEKAYEIIERKVVLTADRYEPTSLSSMNSGNAKYIQLERIAEQLSQHALPQELKREWVKQLFLIWLQHEQTEKLNSIQNSRNQTAAINDGFQHFLQQKAGVKYGALVQAGYPVVLKEQDILEMGWKPVDIVEERQKRKAAASIILTKLSAMKAGLAVKHAPNPHVLAINTVAFNPTDLTAQHKLHKTKNYVPPTIEYLNLLQTNEMAGNTLTFLRTNPIPSPQGLTEKQCTTYFQEVAKHLILLKNCTGLENRRERINEYCHLVSATLFALPYPPPAALVSELTDSLLQHYRAEDDEGSLDEAFMNLENAERSLLLTSLIKLHLAAINQAKDPRVHPKFFSMIKQWENLIIPHDKAMAAKINQLIPDETKPAPNPLLKKVELAIHASPVGLEGLYEGQRGLQLALTDFGRQKSVDSVLRQLADRLGMRNGDALLSSQIMSYYANKAFLLSSEGINSTQGRELFSRAVLHAFRTAKTRAEQSTVLRFLRTLPLDQKRNPCALKASHESFIEMLLATCATSEPDAYQQITGTDFPATTAIDSFITACTIKSPLSPKEPDATDRLFGFAQQCNLLALRIEYFQRKKQPLHSVDEEQLINYYAQFICSNLAYQLTYNQATEDVLSNLQKNFEFTREMGLVQANINKLHQRLTWFASSLNDKRHAVLFKQIYNEYQKNEAFDGVQVPLKDMPEAVKDIPGFIALGRRYSLDVVHGVLYLGANKLDVMPTHIQSHTALHLLGIDTLPFKPHDGGYIYVEGDNDAAHSATLHASIIPQKDGSLTIQRKLKTLDGCLALLQYISPEQMDSIPISLQRRLKIEHYFVDSSGSIHGFDATFTPLLKLDKGDDLDWSGLFIDHRGDVLPLQLDSNDAVMTQKLAKIFPLDELIKIDSNRVYVPAIKKYVLSDNKSEHYILSASPLLSDTGARQQLSIMPQGCAYATNELSPSEDIELSTLQTKLTALKQEVSTLKELVRTYSLALQEKSANRLSPEEKEQLQHHLKEAETRIKLLTGSGLLSKQARAQTAKNINELTDKINQLTAAEYFVFVGKSPDIINLEQQERQLEKELNEVHKAFMRGETEKTKFSPQYESTKKAYLQIKKQLDKAYASASYLRTYDEKQGALKAKDMQSILHIGLIEGKLSILTQLLGHNLPLSPLKTNELEQLHSIKTRLENKKAKNALTLEDRIALLMLIGVELQHHILERTATAHGTLDAWNRTLFNNLLTEFHDAVSELKEQSATLPAALFSELWRSIRSEFKDGAVLDEFFIPPVITVETGEAKPISLNTRTTDMPIESLGARSLVQVHLLSNPHAEIDATQLELEHRLKKQLSTFKQSIHAQEDGYYYENYGVFNALTIEKLLSVRDGHTGLGGISQKQVAELFALMVTNQWIRSVGDKRDNKYQLSAHPSEFYSTQKIAGYLASQGFSTSDINAISDRLEPFLYQTAVNGGSYAVRQGQRNELIQRITQAQERCHLEYLAAQDKIEALLAGCSAQTTLTELNAAYLLNDYRTLLAKFPHGTDLKQTEIALNNAMTRMLYYKTEEDHFKDIQAAMSSKQDAKAVAMLHVKRNYSLDRLLASESAVDTATSADALQLEQKMQRAFLLFESEFGHRCTTRQVNVFRGLLLDDECNPDKIDSAQARMGFGKTTLLPLVALYKTDQDKLVRFIVPKSALETNTADMSAALSHLLAGRAVKDDFQRYKIETDPEEDMGLHSLRLHSLQNAKEDLQKRFALYERIKANREVLVQAPNVRNSMECQAKIFLELLQQIKPKDSAQRKELMECISLLNDIRSIVSVSIFDELDATQDSATTDVNYTSGIKESIDPAEIYPLELISQVIKSTEDKTPSYLAKKLLAHFNIMDDAAQNILQYVTHLGKEQPAAVTAANSIPIYLIRAVLTDPNMLSIFTEKEAGTDFGIWFQNAPNGGKHYDYDALKANNPLKAASPLLITVPYQAANTPKPKGSRFDNPEVTAITTFLYYLDPRTEVQEVPHLEFLINSFRNGVGEKPFLDVTGQHIAPEFLALFNKIKELAEIEDPVFRTAERTNYFTHLDKGEAFRRMLARTIIQEQIQFDTGKANSNRYEQGTSNDTLLGFSGTAGDTSSYFTANMLDPAADGMMTLGIMGRKDCQNTCSLDTQKYTQSEDYTTALIKDLARSFTNQSRTLIDVGGLCKRSNRAVALELALQLQAKKPPLNSLKGVIFYDDVSNMKKVLSLKEGKEHISDLTAEMVADSDKNGSYFTYYDQSHSRGADIKQMDGAHAHLTLHFTVTNNDYKQAIMRMRKIVDKTSGQSFSIAMPDTVKEQILVDLNLKKTDRPTGLTGNDVAFWLRQKELNSTVDNVSILSMELDSVIKNAIMQQQAAITHLFKGKEWSPQQTAIFTNLLSTLNKISPFITGSPGDLKAKYGGVYGTTTRDAFIKKLENSFAERMQELYAAVDTARAELKIEERIPHMRQEDPYFCMKDKIIAKRKPQLSLEFVIPSERGNTLAEAEAVTENQSQSESQSQSQTQTHSFSEVNNEEVVVDAVLKKQDFSFKPVSIAYLSQPEAISSLNLASTIPHLTHLFLDSDPIRCSPQYTQEDPLPPVRYFIARQEGDPLIILLNQDEANQFKSQPYQGWSLYDVRNTTLDKLAQVKILVPLAGPMNAANEPLLKKINFAAYKTLISGSSVSELAHSFAGILTPRQLQPSLSIHSTDGASNDAAFVLNQWGFSGTEAQVIAMTVQQTNTLHVQVDDKEYKEQGITFCLGKDDAKSVFLSSVLNKRFSAEQLPIREMQAQINQHRREAIDKNTVLKAKHHELRERKNTMLSTYAKQIAELKHQRDEVINKGSKQLNERFPAAMNYLLDARDWDTGVATAYYNLHYVKVFVGNQWEGKKRGFKYDGKIFKRIEQAAVYALDKLYQQNEKKQLSPHELNTGLDTAINNIFNAVEARLHEYIPYERYDTVLIDALYEACQEPQFKKKGNKKSGKGSQHSLNEEIYLWGDDFDMAFPNLLYDIYTELMVEATSTVAQRDKYWDALQASVKHEILKARGQTPPPTKEEFLQTISTACSMHLNHHPDAQELKTTIEKRLKYSVHAGPDEEKNEVAMKESIKDLVVRDFVEVCYNAEAGNADFYKKLYPLIEDKVLKIKYATPERLLDYSKHPINKEEIKAAVKKAYALQNVSTTEAEFDLMTNDVAERLSGQKALIELLEHYRPIKGRSIRFPPLEGQERIMFMASHEILTKMDEDVLQLEEQIRTLKQQRKEDCARIEQQCTEVKKEVQTNAVKMTELNLEYNAMRKMLGGLRTFYNKFTVQHNVHVAEVDEAPFFEAHFNLPNIIAKQLEFDTVLTFSPPEYYQVHKEMEVQRQQLHGLEPGFETRVGCALVNADRVIKEDAELVRARDCLINGLQVEYGVEQQIHTEVKNEVSLVELPKGQEPISDTERAKNNAQRYRGFISEVVVKQEDNSPTMGHTKGT